ncbi:STAS/SEC14 domain-containing protein [Thermodesulfobacteriota bacterium]
MEDKTNYKISTSVNEGITEITITGEVAKDAIDQLHDEVVTMLKGKDTKALLVDIREVKAHRDDFSAAFFRTRSLPQDIIRLPAAVVQPSQDKDYISFYETTAANVGQSVKWFADIESARTWLKSKI